MTQQIEFRYNNDIIKITDNGTKETLEIKRSGNTLTSIEEDKKELLNRLINSQKGYDI